MADPKTIKKAFERNRKAVGLRPSVGKSKALTKIRVTNGTTCEIESGSKKLICDVGHDAGGNDAGPGPGILERGALGSCLAIGYATWAAVLEVPVDSIEVEVETEFDARGMLGIDGYSPGFTAIQYTVYIQSPVKETKIQEVVDCADRYSPVLDDFKRAISINREININGKTIS